MGDAWGPLSLETTPRPTPAFAWPTGSTTPKDVDDQAPIPLIVGIALALFIGFVIIVCCICRRRSLSSSSSNNNQDCNAVYQRAPTGDGGAGGGVFSAGVGGNAYPMAPVNSMYPSAQGPQTMVGMPGQPVAGGMNMGQHQPPAAQQQYPALPPNAYTPPYPLGNSPLPAYMPTSQSSHTSSASGPSSEHGPSGFSSSSPPAPAPAPTGMMAVGSINQPSVTVGGLAPQPRPPEMGAVRAEPGYSYVGQSQGGFGVQGQGGHGFQGQTGYGIQGQGIQGQGMGHPGFQMSPMNQRGMIGSGMTQGSGYGPQGTEAGTGMGKKPSTYPPTMHPTAMDYVPGGGFVPRVGSPMPPGTTVTELDQL